MFRQDSQAVRSRCSIKHIRISRMVNLPSAAFVSGDRGAVIGPGARLHQSMPDDTSGWPSVKRTRLTRAIITIDRRRNDSTQAEKGGTPSTSGNRETGSRQMGRGSGSTESCLSQVQALLLTPSAAAKLQVRRHHL